MEFLKKPSGLSLLKRSNIRDKESLKNHIGFPLDLGER